MSAGKPFDIGHASALWELGNRRIPARDGVALALWRRDLAALILRGHSLSAQDLSLLAHVAERGPRLVAGRPRRELNITLLASLHFGVLSLRDACRVEALRARGKREGQPSEADMKAAEKAISRALREKGWSVGGAAPLRPWGPQGQVLRRGRIAPDRLLRDKTRA